MPTRRARETKKKDPTGGSGSIISIVVGVMGMLGTIIAALIGQPDLVREIIGFEQPTPTATATQEITPTIALPTITLTPSVTATVTPLPSPTLTFTPEHTATADPSSPEQVVIQYYHSISLGDYDIAWAMLTGNFKKTMGFQDYASYKTFWQQYKEVQTSSVRLIKQTNTTAVVRCELVYIFLTGTKSKQFTMDFYLVTNPLLPGWLIETAAYPE